MKVLTLVLLFALGTTLPAWAKSSSTYIKVRTNSRVLKVAFKNLDEVVRFELDLGESVKSLEVINSKAVMSVTQLFETSVSIQDEGPHWDLTKWRHGATEHMTLTAEKNIYPVITVPISDKNLPFPEVSLDDMIAEVKRTGGPQGMVELAKKCVDLHTYPCAVGVSSILFFVGEETGLDNQPTKKIVFSNPMGC